MKKLFLLLFLLTSQIILAQSKIDSIKNFLEVQEFVKTIRPTFRFVELSDFNIPRLDQLLNKKNYTTEIITNNKIDSNYYIRDFNNDGYKDLLIYGYEKELNILVIMNHGDSYKTYNLYLDEYGDNYIFPKIENNDNIITLYEIETIGHERMTNQQKPLKHLLAFHEGEFVEYNPNPKEYTIDSIRVLMSCPWWHPYKYYFKIDNTTLSGWTNDHKERINLPQLSDRQWTLIKKRLNYADFPSISLPEYMIIDNITYITTVFYNNGLSHNINDNHGYVNRSLSSIYKEIMPLKEKIDEILKEKNKPRLPRLK